MKKVLILFVLLLTGCAQQSTSIPTQQDTNWTSGQLDNGLRYHIYPLDTEAISLRLFVHAAPWKKRQTNLDTLTLSSIWHLTAVKILRQMKSLN